MKTEVTTIEGVQGIKTALLQVVELDIHLRDYSESPKKARLYVHETGESVFENLMNRHSRPVDEYRKVIAKLVEAKKLPEMGKLKWSQKAGCSCGCSPGFIVQDQFWGQSLWVTVAGLDWTPEKEAEQKRAEEAVRTEKKYDEAIARWSNAAVKKEAVAA